ncbi:MULTISPECIES: acyl-CoA dehydrogenase family protein [unclassified Aeromicrobium]|uniref:acyl-CoA dehydrogenase family protein n=1 Tax=unclassified Aeromicrobium TaxID=2633570 RepID=UPI0006FCB836|nr:MULTISPECIES: acyl-CoA dehydrogenase family protein [unclassified Aeromicrobium]KQX74382.1 acyl-CoA dehydrogenase [Aeromicrobium sp. Root472D3]MBD8608606.1 acyl-CoA dehydrogenase family protein [Aeromicrobium sp. CFBP 8757]
MDFTLDSEQTALRDAVRGLLGKAYGSSETRREVTKTDPGWDEKTWQRLAEMGALGLPFAEEDGGFGAGPVEVSVVAEEIGRVIAPEPYVEAVVLAGGLVAAAGTAEQRAEIIGALAEGTLVPAFAHTEAQGRYGQRAYAVTASHDGDAWTLSGVKEPVLGGARADLLVVSADVDGATALFLVQPDAAGLTRTSYSTFDGGRAAHVAFDATPATPLGEAGADQSAVIAQAVAAAQIAYGHEALGAMAFALETTTEYLKSRKQFGVPLMTFQALTFRAADMYVSLELARSTVTWATLVLLDGDADATIEAASRAKLQVSKAGRHIGQEAIQLHGGIGMTAEYSVGHYTSRLTAIDHALGDGRHHLGALSATLDDHEVLEPLP